MKVKLMKKSKKVASPELKAQLAQARAALASTGMSSRQIGCESKTKALDWIHKWGYTSASIIMILLCRTSAGYVQKLAKQGLLVLTRTESGIPPAIATLSDFGLQEISQFADSLVRYPESEPHKINQMLIKHNILAQLATANALNAGVISDYSTERMFDHDGDKSGIKRPDIIWLTPTGLRFAVEVELSQKWDRDLHEFILAIIRALEFTEGHQAKFSRFLIITHSPAIKNNYAKAMQPGAALPLWKKNARGHWAIDNKMEVPDWLINKVDFQLIEK